MSDNLEPRDELTERLAALGRQPVSPALQSEHLTAMASVRSGRSAFRTSLAGRLKVGAGVLGGFLLGASGLTAAGAMGPLQPIAATVAAEVANVDVPQGPKDKAEKAAKAASEKAAKARLEDGSIGTRRQWTGCEPTTEGGTTFAGNRGLYLKQIRATGDAQKLADAKASLCGLPEGATKDATDSEAKTADDNENKPENPGKSEDETHGKSADAPGKQDDPAAAGKAKGEEESEGAKPETPAGPPDAAGESGIAPPVGEDSSQVPATPDTPESTEDDDV